MKNLLIRRTAHLAKKRRSSEETGKVYFVRVKNYISVERN
jgi:hypothetical protein